MTRGAPCCSAPLSVIPWYSSPFPCPPCYSSAFLVLYVLHFTPLHSSYSVGSTALPGTPFCSRYSRVMHNDLHTLRTLSHSALSCMFPDVLHALRFLPRTSRSQAFSCVPYVPGRNRTFPDDPMRSAPCLGPSEFSKCSTSCPPPPQ